MRYIYGEERWQTIGMTNQGVIFVVYTERDEGNIIRLISAAKRKSMKNWHMKKEVFPRLAKRFNHGYQTC